MSSLLSAVLLVMAATALPASGQTCPAGTTTATSNNPSGGRESITCLTAQSRVAELYLWWPNGQLRRHMVANTIAKIQDDQDWDNQGRLTLKITLQPDGSWQETDFYPEGRRRAEGLLSAANLQRRNDRKGTWVGYFPSGKKSGEWIYSSGPAPSDCFAPLVLSRGFNEAGHMISETHFDACKKTGTETFWYDNGQKRAETVFQDSLPEGAWSCWLPDGTLLASGTVTQGTGPYLEIYETGQKRLEGFYKNRKQDGLWTTYYPNGQKTSEGRYSQGALDGSWSYWYFDGSLKSKANVRAGQLLGVQASFSPIGAFLIGQCYGTAGTLTWTTTNQDALDSRSCP